VLAMAAMSMPAVHEKVHQRAKHQRQIKKCAEHVGPVLGEEQDSGDGKKAEQNKPGARCQKAALRLISTPCVFMH
jgi:hypothetical protein